MFVTEEKYNDRYKICNTCEHKKTMFDMLEKCEQCGCILPMKIKLDSSKCPLNKW